jgi:hypothetical protein
MMVVTIALTAGDSAVIAKGLEGGEQVIVEGQNQVRAGGKVDPVGAGGNEPGTPGGARTGPQGPHNRPGSGQSEQGPAAAPGNRPVAGQSEQSPAAGQGTRRPVSGQMVDRGAVESSRPREPATGPAAAGAAPAGQ